MKKIIIIGAGIAGLTCANYLQLNGFDTEIYELHTLPGGECTGWDRKGYHFDGCIHWLVGSKRGTDLNEVWRDTGALDDSVKIILHDTFARYEEAGGAVNFYTDARKLEAHLISIAPEDKKAIKAFCKAIRKTGGFSMPIDKPMDKMTAGDGIAFAVKNLWSIGTIMKYNKMTVRELSETFNNKLLQRAIHEIMPADYPAIALVSTLAGMNSKDCGYPEGGSKALAKRMEQKYLSRGGKVFYKSRVEKILVENAKAVGIRLSDGREAYADMIVSCADGYATLKYMLEDKYTPDMYKNLFENPKEFPTVTSSLVFMGVNADIKTEYRSLEISREKPLAMHGTKYNSTMLLNYNFDRSVAPEGKTVFACYYNAEYDFWKGIYADKEKYNAEKKKLEEDAVSVLVNRFPEALGKIEATDVVTPMTYERFCNAWRGAWMTWTVKKEGVPQYYPGILPGLENFIMAGMWTLPPGGLPGASTSGRYAAHRICLENKAEFKHGVE